MSREAVSSCCQLRDAIAPHRDPGGRNGVSTFAQSGSKVSAVDNQPARIFIVEDDPVILRMIGDYLEQHNMHAVFASGRQEMVRNFAVSDPDLLVLDLRLGHGRARPAARD